MTNRLQKIEKAVNSMSDDKFNELLDDLGVKEEKQWVPKYGERYWIIFTSGCIARDIWRDTSDNKYRLLMKNVFKTEEEALTQRNFNLEKAKLIKEIEDSSDVIDWGDSKQNKHSLFYDHYVDKVDIGEREYIQSQGTTFTTNKEFLKNLIANEPERIKKYLFGIEE